MSREQLYGRGVGRQERPLYRFAGAQGARRPEHALARAFAAPALAALASAIVCFARRDWRV